MKSFSVLLCTLLSVLSFSSCRKTADLYVAEESVLLDKVKGAWAAKMIGVEYGMPLEFVHCGKTYDGDICWRPEMIEGALRQDDIYGQANFMMTLDALGLDAPADSLARNFAEAAFPLCHSNLQARKNYFDGIPVAELSFPENNIHCEDLDFQIEADFIGIVHPAMLQSSRKMAEKVGSIMSCADGLYGGIFVSSLDAAAYCTDNIPELVSLALQTIPHESTYAECISDVLDSYRADSEDWRAAWKSIEKKWGAYDVCTPYIPFNIDAKINGAYIAIALLYGKGDFEKTMEIAVRCGQDTDCNASSAAVVLGIMKGYDSIPDKFKSHLESISDKKFLFTDYSFNDLVAKSMEFIAESTAEAGGKVEDGVFHIARQVPEPADYREGFGNMRLSYIKSVADAGYWNFDDKWDDFSYNDPGDMAPYKVAVMPGAEMSCRFEGSGFALLGSWNSHCGKAKIYVDGDFVKEIDAYYREEAGKYEGNRAYLCHITGLEAGEHKLELVVSDEKNPASYGHKIYLEKIIVYK